MLKKYKSTIGRLRRLKATEGSISPKKPSGSKIWRLVEEEDGSKYYAVGFLRTSKARVLIKKKSPTPQEWANAFNKLTPFERGTSNYTPMNELIIQTVPIESEMLNLPSGYYRYESESGYSVIKPKRLIPINLRTERVLENEMSTKVKKDIKDFIANEELYREGGSLYKMGMLFYGPPGTGKTSLIMESVRGSVPDDSIVLFLSELPDLDFLSSLDASTKGRLKVFIFEEFVHVIDETGLMSVLNFLDGVNSVDNMLVMATTNYPENLPGNVVDRPSRFDKRYKIGYLGDSDRRKFLEHFMKRDITDLEVELTKLKSVAELKELSRLVRITGMDFGAAIQHLKELSEEIKKNFSETKKVGF